MCGMKGTELGLEHENLGLLGDGKKENCRDGWRWSLCLAPNGGENQHWEKLGVSY